MPSAGTIERVKRSTFILLEAALVVPSKGNGLTKTIIIIIIIIIVIIGIVISCMLFVLQTTTSVPSVTLADHFAKL